MASKKTDPRADPSTPSLNYNAMRNAWGKIDVVLGGTESMRAAGESLMPKHENESDLAYDERRSRATLLNLAELTLDSWTGKPFSEPVSVEDDVPEQIEEWLENIDMQGNNISVFARDWFREGLAKCFSHVLVDAPSEEAATMADDAGRRPFLNYVAPENLIAARSTVVDGEEVLTHVRILEQEVVADGFAEKTVDRIRQFDRILRGDTALRLPGAEETRALFEGGTLSDEEVEARQLFEPGVYVTLWERRKNKGEEEWVVIQPATRLDDRMDEIPIVTFYANRKGLLLGKSPLEDLVDLNINWWQSNSDQNIILTVCRFPLLAASGVEEEESEMEVGPRRMLWTSKEQGEFYYVEHSGAAIEAGRQNLKDLEEQMAHYGAEFLKKRPGSETATARALDTAEATSPLQDATMRFNESLNAALRLMGKWVGIEEVGTVTVSTEFEALVEDESHDHDVLDKARARGDLSKKDFFEELKLRKTLRETFDYDENEENLASETMDGASETDLDLEPEPEEDVNVDDI